MSFFFVFNVNSVDEAYCEPLQKILFVTLKCLDTLEVIGRLPQLVTNLSTCSTHYYLLDTLVPPAMSLE